MIKKKLHICECGRNSYGYKRCQSCRSKEYQKRIKHRKQETSKVLGDNLAEYYTHHINKIQSGLYHCEECDTPIYKKTTSTNVAHILPKSVFISVRSLLENYLYLCGDCHSKYDSSYENAAKMKVWAIALNRLKAFLHLVREKRKELQYFK